MKKTLFRFLPIVLVGFLVVKLLPGCFNINFNPRFQMAERPEGPLSRYFEGSLGIVKGSFGRVFLFGAFRTIQGLKLNSLEAHSLTMGRSNPTGALSVSSELEVWNRARSIVRVLPAGTRNDYFTRQYRSMGKPVWTYYLNCNGNAFRSATDTLKARIQKFGIQSKEVRLWLDGQEVVFKNCGGGRKIPAPLSADTAPLIRADRKYQIAAAYFYSGAFDEAARRFEEISRDSSSPWRSWGNYLAARCLIRKGTLVHGYGKIDPASLQEAAQRLRDTLADPGQESLHESARGLLDYVLLRLQPKERATQLAAVLTSPRPGKALGQAWADFDYLLAHGQAGSHELASWIQAMRGGRRFFELSLGRWRSTGKNDWLVAALASARADDKGMPQLLQGASQVSRSSPAFITTTYHRLRLLIELKRNKKAREELDHFLKAPPNPLRTSSLNAFLALRFRLARNFKELLRFAPREPLDMDFYGSPVVGGDRKKKPSRLSYLRPGEKKYLDKDALVAFNRLLPLRLLEKAVRSEDFPLPIRRELSLAVWARAALLEQWNSAERLSDAVGRYWPGIKHDLARLRRQTDPQARRFELVFFLLRHPGIRPYLIASLHRQFPPASASPTAERLRRINNLRENWWCSLDENEPMHESGFVKQQRVFNPPAPGDRRSGRVPEGPDGTAFLSPRERRSAADQLLKLRRLPTAPNFLAAATIGWSRKHPADPRVPQALHLVVRATRFGCKDKDTTSFSKRAFRLLHRHYPHSRWTKATPYYY